MTIALHKKSGDAINWEDLDKIFDESMYKYSRPHVRGVLVNYDFQMNIWNKFIHEAIGDKNAKGYSLTITNPIVSPQRSKEKLLEILFEYYGFSALSVMR